MAPTTKRSNDIAPAPVQNLIVANRERIKRGKLRAFCKVFWPVIQPEKFIWGWHAGAVCEHLEAVTNGEIKKLLIVLPPGHMKSSLISVFWPAWEWSIRPDEKYIFASYAERISFELASKHRDIIKSDHYRELFPGTDIGDNVDRASFFKTTKNGFRFSTTPGGAVTGFHGTRSVFDDISKAQDAHGKSVFDPVAIQKANDFWFKTMPSRVGDVERHASVGVMQRIHSDDTAGRCIDAGYHVLSLPMEFDGRQYSTSFIDPRKEGDLLWPERFSAEFVANLKSNLSDRDYEAQYQQRPVPPGGNVFKREWFQTWGTADSKYPSFPRNATVFQTWDLTFKGSASSDWVVGQVWALVGLDFLLLAQYRGKWGFSETKEAMMRAQKEWPQTCATYVEDKANGPAIMDDLKTSIATFEAIEPMGGKEARANAIQPTVRNGHVYLPAADWVEELIKECADFPYARHDDQVDALTQGLVRMRTSGSLMAFYESLSE